MKNLLNDANRRLGGRLSNLWHGAKRKQDLSCQQAAAHLAFLK